MYINLVSLASRNFHTFFYWLYQVALPDVCLKHIFVLFFSNQAIQRTNLWWRLCTLSMTLFVFLGHLSKFISGNWCQAHENCICICEYLGLDVYALLLLTRETEIVFLRVHCWQARERAHWAVKVDIWYTATQPAWWQSCMLHSF